MEVGERGKNFVLFQLILPFAARKCLSIHNWRVDQSFIPVPPMYVSSAYARIVKFLWLMVMPCMFERSALKSGSMDRLERRGAKGSPWGTPCLIGKGELSLPLIKIEVCRWW